MANLPDSVKRFIGQIGYHLQLTLFIITGFSYSVCVGLSSNDAQHVINNRSYKKAVEKDWSRSKEMFVTAVPTFLINEQRVVGAQSYDVLKQFMIKNNVAKNV